MGEIKLLTEEQVYGDKRLDIIEKMGTKCALSDFAILLGAFDAGEYIDGDKSKKGRSGWWYLSSNHDRDVYTVAEDGVNYWLPSDERDGGIRPVLSISDIPKISLNKTWSNSDFFEVEYGEYPQYVVDVDLGNILDELFQSGKLQKTGKTYTTDSRISYNHLDEFKPIQHEEFEYKGKRYARIKSFKGVFELSNELTIPTGMYAWLEVSPIKWIVDNKAKIMVSKTLLASGVRFCNSKQYRGDFENTEMYHFLNTYFVKEIIPSKMLRYEKHQENGNKRRGIKIKKINVDKIEEIEKDKERVKVKSK